MRLKLNDDGFAFVSDDGHPVFLMGDDDDNLEEQAVDVPALYAKVPDLTKEATKYRKQRNEVRDSLKLFDGIDDLNDWKTKADEALNTVQNLKDKELVDAGKVEQIKSAMKDAHAQELKDVKTSYEAKIEELATANSAKDGTIYNLMVSAKFASSPYFTGTEQNPPKTLLPPEIAETYFGKQFKVEQGNNGGLTVIGYDANGNQLYSRKRPGELADFDEAMDQIISAYPGRDGIMRAAKAGSGAGGGQGGGVGTQGEMEKLQAQYDEAVKANDGKQAIAIKNRIHALRMKEQGKQA
jgi:hypothetical protein